MDKLSNNFRGLIRFMGVFGIIIAYIGFAVTTVFFVKQAYDIVINPQSAIQVSPIIPGVELVGTGLTFPLVIGWISLFIIICVHEFSHGVVARAFNIPVKSSGFVFFGPIPGAFVEPDEKVLLKKKAYKQLAVFAAGPVSNIFLTAIMMLISLFVLVPIFNSFTYSEGIIITPMDDSSLPLYKAGIHEKTLLKAINGNDTLDYASLDSMLNSLKPNEEAILNIDGKDVEITLAPHPDNASKPYIGFNMLRPKLSSFLPIGFSKISPKKNSFDQKFFFHLIIWLDELFFWIAFISINVGMFNLLPLFITDGARMLLLNFGEKKMIVWKVINFVMLTLIFTIIFLPIIRNFIPGFFVF